MIVYGELGHLTGLEASMITEQANVNRLVLTHFGPGADALELQRAGARKFYKGIIDVAATEAVYWV